MSSPGLSAQAFLARYEGLASRLPGDARLRHDSADLLRRLGLPGKRDEAWKYTNLAALSEERFHEPLTVAGGEERPFVPEIGGFEGVPRLVFMQGRFDRAHSLLPDKARMRAFAEQADFGGLARPDRDRMVALNTMLAEDGAQIAVDAGIDAGVVLLVSSGHAIAGTPTAFHPRHTIRLAPGARLTLVEFCIGHGKYLHNPVIEISVGEGARLHHVRLQNEAGAAYHFATLYADIATGAAYEAFTLSLGARIARSEFHAHLHGAGGHVALNAVQLLRDKQHSDITTVVSHDAPGCTSRQTVKHVLADRARGVFQGKIEVARAAQKTDGYQMNQALLLSSEAEIDCKPQLEIFADDVKCSHGATVGDLDAEQLFYLRSRGVPAEEAKAILVRAFLGDALELIENEAARHALEHAVGSWWGNTP